ncbi:MAG: hypothetical protein ABR538_15510, partial [Candidatus Binatia bacterium]
MLTRRAAELAAAAAAVALYLPALGYGFVFDDEALIGPDGSPLALGGSLPYRPLRYASYLIDGWLGGTSTIYHLHNVLLHGLVAALTVALARRLGASRVAALAGGLLLAFHPLAVEAVAYVAGRRDLLCVALGLGAVLACLSGRQLVSLLLLLLAAAAKESALVFAVPLAAAAATGLDGGAAAQRPGRAFALAAATAAAVALVVAYGAIGPWGPSVDPAGLAFPGRVALHYLAGLAGLREFAPEYPELMLYADRVRLGEAAAVWGGAAMTLLLGVAAAASLAACARAGRSPRPAFLTAWTTSVLAALAVWGGLHEPGVDRHAYLLLPVAAVVVAVSLSPLSRLLARGDRRALAAAAVACLLLTGSASATRAQMETWRSERSLWNSAGRHPSASSRALANLARQYAVEGRYPKAANKLTAAIAASPGDAGLFLARAAVRCAQGRGLLANGDFERARRAGADPAAV